MQLHYRTECMAKEDALSNGQLALKLELVVSTPPILLGLFLPMSSTVSHYDIDLTLLASSEFDLNQQKRELNTRSTSLKNSHVQFIQQNSRRTSNHHRLTFDERFGDLLSDSSPSKGVPVEEEEEEAWTRSRGEGDHNRENEDWRNPCRSASGAVG